MPSHWTYSSIASIMISSLAAGWSLYTLTSMSLMVGGVVLYRTWVGSWNCRSCETTPPNIPEGVIRTEPCLPVIMMANVTKVVISHEWRYNSRVAGVSQSRDKGPYVPPGMTMSDAYYSIHIYSFHPPYKSSITVVRMAQKHLVIHTGSLIFSHTLCCITLWTVNVKPCSTSRSGDPFTQSLWMSGQSEPCWAGSVNVEVCCPHPPSCGVATVSLHVTVPCTAVPLEFLPSSRLRE